MQATIRTGCGYWNVTRFPKGGDFRRADKDQPFEVIRDLGPELYGKLPSGDLVIVGKSETKERPCNN